MKINSVTLFRIKASILLTAENKKKLINSWSDLSEEKQSSIIKLLNFADDAQKSLIEKATSLNSNFLTELKFLLRKKRSNKNKKEEAKQNYQDYQEAERIIKNI